MKMKQLKLWKRNAVVLAIAVFVCGAVYLNWDYGRQEDTAGKTLGESVLVANPEAKVQEGEENAAEGTAAETAVSDSGYFSEARLSRQQSRDTALTLLREAAGDEKASQEKVDEANAAIQTMANYTITEAEIENLVMAKGYANCFAFMNDDSISVVVTAAAEELSDADVAKIGEIVMEQTGLTGNQIKIVPMD